MSRYPDEKKVVPWGNRRRRGSSGPVWMPSLVSLGCGVGLLLLPGLTRGAPLDQAHLLLISGQYQKAEAAYKKLGNRGPARLGLARVQLETGRWEEAVKTARAAARGKLRPGALTLVGEAQREMGQLAAAVKTLKQALAGAPRHYRALHLPRAVC